MQKLITIFQNVGNMVQADASLKGIVRDLPFPIEEYNMTAENGSTFLDIGAGFGKPNYHAAMQTGCQSYGVEIVQMRVAYT